MRHTLAVILTLLSGIGVCGCASQTSQTPAPSADDGASQRWRTSQDYYALLELVDTHIDPAMNNRNVSKADVIKYLGKGIDDPDGYPNAGPNFWVYISSRPVPYGSYLYVEFGDDGFVKDVSWGSE